MPPCFCPHVFPQSVEVIQVTMTFFCMACQAASEYEDTSALKCP